MKKFVLLVIILLLAMSILFLILVTHRPAQYAPVKVADKNQISPYLTHNLLPTIYNNSQLDKPFEVVITEQGLNDIVAGWPLPLTLQNIIFTDPQVILTPQQITLMAIAQTKPVNLVATVELNPTISRAGLLNLHINCVKLGAVNVTTLAKLIGDKAYSNWLSSTGTDPDNIAAWVCRSLLNDEPFEPTFEIGDRTLRLSKIDVSEKKITALLTPLPDESHPAYHR